jgi:hypothetical protein
MGADARLFLFDYEIYRSEVLPAFLRLMRDSSIDTWLMELHRLHTDGLGIDECLARHSVSLAPVDILKHCTYLDPDLAVRTVRSDPQSLYDCGWETRACRSADCSVRDQCPFHFVEEPQQTITVDYLLRLFQMAVADRCLGPGQFLGRSIDCFFYWKTLDELGVAPADPIHLLLQQLGRRGFLIGYAFAVGTDGIHGWLQPDEVKQLAERLFALDLPEYECSFAAMEKFQNVRNIVEDRVVGLDFQRPVYHDPSGSFERLSLSFVRTVCNLAAREGKGVLWGNDLLAFTRTA